MPDHTQPPLPLVELAVEPESILTPAQWQRATQSNIVIACPLCGEELATDGLEIDCRRADSRVAYMVRGPSMQHHLQVAHAATRRLT